MAPVSESLGVFWLDAVDVRCSFEAVKPTNIKPTATLIVVERYPPFQTIISKTKNNHDSRQYMEGKPAVSIFKGPIERPRALIVVERYWLVIPNNHSAKPRKIKIQVNAWKGNQLFQTSKVPLSDLDRCRKILANTKQSFSKTKTKSRFKSMHGRKSSRTSIKQHRHRDSIYG